jgi:Ca-activated chloride channel homolog
MEDRKNLYALLGLPDDAVIEEIKRAHRKAARRLHPDANPAPGAVESFLKIQQAYETLSNQSLRTAYDSTLPAEQNSLDEISINIVYSQPFIKETKDKQVLYGLVDISAKLDRGEKTSTPLNICLLVDTSTSMQGYSLDTVKEAAHDLVNQLRPDDYLSIVSFNDRAEVLLPASSSANRATAEKAIRMLKTNGGTEIGKGLKAAFTEVQKYTGFEMVSHIILMTDGRTYGDEEDCLKIAEGAAINGIVITGLGIGSRWNDEFLDTLTGMTGGSSTYLEDVKDIRKLLPDKFNVLARRFAERVTLDLDLGTGVHINYIMRIKPDPAPGLLEMPAIMGSLPCTSPLTLLIEFQLEGASAGPEFCFASGFLSFEVPSRAKPVYIKRISFQLPVKDGPSSRPPDKILEAISFLTFYRMQEKAKLDLEQGDAAGAAVRLEHLATRLFTQGEHQLASTILIEAENIQINKTMSDEGKKRIKYGTRALMLPGSFLNGSDVSNQKMRREEP